MKTKNTNELIENLNTVVTYFRDNKKLFCGGCCYSAYLLALGFERLGIKYSVIMFQNGRNWNTNKFNRVCTGYGCGHIAIRVVYKHKKFIIGSDENYDNKIINSLGKNWKIREYKKINSKDLIEIYKNNTWNWRWDKRYNNKLSNVIKNIFKEYEK